jgi:hypothetical protein
MVLKSSSYAVRTCYQSFHNICLLLLLRIFQALVVPIKARFTGCNNDVTVVLQRFYSGVTAVLQ